MDFLYPCNDVTVFWYATYTFSLLPLITSLKRLTKVSKGEWCPEFEVPTYVFESLLFNVCKEFLNISRFKSAQKYYSFPPGV